MNINELINEKLKIKDKMAVLNADLKECRKTQDELDRKILSSLDQQGLSRTANDKASVSINNDTVPEVTDWDALYKYIDETKDYSLLQRRPSSTAYKELLKLKENIPGMQPRQIRRVNIRSL